MLLLAIVASLVPLEKVMVSIGKLDEAIKGLINKAHIQIELNDKTSTLSVTTICPGKNKVLSAIISFQAKDKKT